MDSSALGRILSANGADDEGLNAQAMQFDTNTYSDDPEISSAGNSGVAAINLKTGKRALNVESDEGMIISFKMMKENNNPDMEQKCQ